MIVVQEMMQVCSGIPLSPWDDDYEIATPKKTRTLHILTDPFTLLHLYYLTLDSFEIIIIIIIIITPWYNNTKPIHYIK